MPEAITSLIKELGSRKSRNLHYHLGDEKKHSSLSKDDTRLQYTQDAY